ncbi:MAG: lipoyl(octanoyl) transferase LipB [Pseudomonadota bacterium]
METHFFSDLALIPYEQAWRLQLQLVAARQNSLLERDVVLFLEHPPVVTMGRRGGHEHLNVSKSFLEKSGVSLLEVERGGDITYHGPGQLVVYPIIKLGASGLGVIDLVEMIEEVMIRTVADWGLRACRNPLNRGAWIGDDKLGSIGIAVRRGISFHGLALNVNPDLTPFDWITPCGLSGVKMTRMTAHAAGPVTVAEVKSAMKGHWEKIFGVMLKDISFDSLMLCIKETP